MEENQAQWDLKKITLFVIFVAVIIVVPAYLLFNYLMNPITPTIPPVYISDFEMGDDYNFIYGSASGIVDVSLMGEEEIGNYTSELYEFSFENEAYLGFGRYLMTNATGVYVTAYYEFNDTMHREQRNETIETSSFIIESSWDKIIVKNQDESINQSFELQMPLSDIEVDAGRIIAIDTVSRVYVWNITTFEVLAIDFLRPSYIQIRILSPPKPIVLFPLFQGKNWSYSGFIIGNGTEIYNTEFVVTGAEEFHGVDVLVVHEVESDIYYCFDYEGNLIGEKNNNLEFYGGSSG